MNNIYQELNKRGFIYQQTDGDAIEKKLLTEKVVFYVGFDPTGSSLHVGHLLPVMAMRLLQKAGHTPVVLVGGATGQIGDPSGKSVARNILTKEDVAYNAECLKKQLSHFISMEDGSSHFVNNIDWLSGLKYIDFLRDIGSKFSVNRMLAQESVKSRLENGLSFLEFNYSLLQAYDYYILNRDLNCTLEMGGQDQWGNMVAGTELVRKMSDEVREVHCLTIPLLMDSNGQKFGKTAGGKNVWLDVNRTSVFEYYQFWRNCDDNQTRKLLCYFSNISVDEIDDILNNGNNINRAKEILAFEATTLAHGIEQATEAYLAAGSKFGFADPEQKVKTTSSIMQVDMSKLVSVEVPSVTIDKNSFANDGMWICKLLLEAQLVKSTSDGRRLVTGGAVSINDEKISDPSFAVTLDFVKNQEFMLKSGKKSFKLIKLI